MTKKPTGATIVKPDVTADKDEESGSSAPPAKPAAAPKKKPATTSKPAATTSEPAEEKRREPRPPKVNNKIFLSKYCACVFYVFIVRTNFTNIYTCILS